MTEGGCALNVRNGDKFKRQGQGHQGEARKLCKPITLSGAERRAHLQVEYDTVTSATVASFALFVRAAQTVTSVRACNDQKCARPWRRLCVGIGSDRAVVRTRGAVGRSVGRSPLRPSAPRTLASPPSTRVPASITADNAHGTDQREVRGIPTVPRKCPGLDPETPSERPFGPFLAQHKFKRHSNGWHKSKKASRAGQGRIEL